MVIPIPPFHLAIPAHDLAAAERFCAGVLGCRPARRDTRWIDLDFFVRDPSGNALEFESFSDPSRMFGTEHEQESR